MLIVDEKGWNLSIDRKGYRLIMNRIVLVVSVQSEESKHKVVLRSE
jgi:hypothetical protein